MTSSSEFTHLVAIQTPTPVRDGAGGTSYTWATLVSVWAKPHQLKGQEALQAGREQAVQTVRFKMHSLELDTTWRLQWQGNDYEIVEVDDTEALSEGVVWVTGRAVRKAPS